jgi:Phosphomannomutase
MNNIFGTDGIRNRFGVDFLTPENILVIGHALAQWAVQKYGPRPRLLMLHDTRNSCALVKAILQSSLLRYPVYILDAHVLPTPAALQLMDQHNLDGAIIISASHNPYYDNGIKIFDRKVGKLHVCDEETISQLVLQAHTPALNVEKLGVLEVSDGAAEYCHAIVKKFKPQFLTGVKIVLDLAHGAAYVTAPQIFTALGANVVTMNDSPNGLNINKNCGATATQGLQERVLAEKADFGFAFDGDGDRVMAVNRYGVLKDGDDILALLAQHAAYESEKVIVGTVMTNHGFDLWLAAHGKKLVRVAVGDKYIVERLELDGLVLGGEQSGHIIVKDLASSGDGVIAALRILESIFYTQNRDMLTFDHYPQVLVNVPVAVKKDLTCAPYSMIITRAEQRLAGGRIVVRYSGTENCMRVMVEAETRDEAAQIAHDVAQQLQQELK